MRNKKRKKGKLPFETVQETYQLEYGINTLEVHKDAIKEGDSVLIVDDLIATGGTAKASINLVRKLGGEPICAFVIDLPDLKGKNKLDTEIITLIEFDGES